MAKSGTCELCGLPDNSYSVEDNGRVFKVCKLCYDGFIAKHGSDSLDENDDIDELAEQMTAPPTGGAKPQTLSEEQMAKILTPAREERRRINAAVRRAVAAKVEQSLAADTEEITRELLETKAEIEQEEQLAAQVAESVPEPKTEGETAQRAEQSPKTVELPKVQRAEERRKAVAEKTRMAANPKIDDERIKVTSPEVEIKRDTRPKTNYDVATEGHVGAVRFLHAFRFVVNPVVYAVFAGLISLAVFTAYMIVRTWQEAVIVLASGIGAVAIGFLLLWYLKRRLEVDKRTLLLRIRQEEILFNSMTTPCYRELKTKYPMIKALAWLLSRLSVIVPVVVVIGGSAAGIILSFKHTWWLLAPVMVGAALGGVITYYMIKFACDWVNYKLDLERNQQILEQTMLDMLAKKGK